MWPILKENEVIKRPKIRLPISLNKNVSNFTSKHDLEVIKHTFVGRLINDLSEVKYFNSKQDKMKKTLYSSY